MGRKSIDVYETIPAFESSRFLLRQLEGRDAEDLLEVYSDKEALPFFNSDNCHGDNFYYPTIERMREAVAFWQQSYRDKWFVRWSIVDKTCGKVIGTIEVFHRDSGDYFNNAGLLRLDLKSGYETEEYIEDILKMLLADIYILFDCEMIATKAVPAAVRRIKALHSLGFRASGEYLMGNDGTRYGDYYVKQQ